MFKYVAKGPDTAEYRIREETQHDRNDAESVAARNEHAQAKIAEDFIRARYLSATEAAWRIFGNELTHKTPSVQRLAIHDVQENRPQFRGRNATGSDASALIRYFLRPDRYSNMKYAEYYENIVSRASTAAERQDPHHLPPNKYLEHTEHGMKFTPNALSRDFLPYNYNFDSAPAVPLQQAFQSALNALDSVFVSFGLSNIAVGLPAPEMKSVGADAEQAYFAPKRRALRAAAAAAYDRFTTHQKHIYDTILTAISDRSPDRLHLIQGRAGRGKTFVIKGIIDYLRGHGKLLAVCGATGLSASAFDRGTTVHKRFTIPFPLRSAYATTFHGCQGLTLDKSVIDCTTPIFAHGQRYAAISRTRTRTDTQIYTPDGTSAVVNNIVYPELTNLEM
ncbi:unnamed protein product [Tilletia controversa]|nr:unnamed protein product [Tilletia controversa]